MIEIAQIYCWKAGFEGLYKANAQTVAEEIISIGESATPQQIVDVAKNPNTELNKCFEWNDGVAADRYRLWQARDIVTKIVLRRQDGEESEKQPPVRAFYKTKEQSGYVETRRIVVSNDSYEKLLQQAYGELQAFKRKYSMLSELEEILALID